MWCTCQTLSDVRICKQMRCVNQENGSKLRNIFSGFIADLVRIPEADLQFSRQRARRKFSVRENARAART